MDPEQVKIGRKEEVEFMVKKLDMFEFGTYEEAVSRGGKPPTTTKWVEGWKADDKGGRFVRCRLVGRDFKVKGVEEREDLFCGNATSRVEEVDVQDGGCEGAAEEKWARGGEPDVYRREEGPLKCVVRGRRVGWSCLRSCTRGCGDGFTE